MNTYRAHFGWIGWMLMIAVATSLGCGDSASTDGGSDMDALAAQLDQAKQAEANAKAVEEAAAAKAAADQQAADEAAQRAAQQAAAASDETSGQTTNAESIASVDGIVGKKQRRNTVEGPLRYYGAISNARIIALDRALGWQIKKSLDVWVNTHDGKYPKTTEEFMREIIEPNMIGLPELEPKQEFYFDPEDHELKIVELIDEPDVSPPAEE